MNIMPILKEENPLHKSRFCPMEFSLIPDINKGPFTVQLFPLFVEEEFLANPQKGEKT
jgi:hypothetical protein